MKDIFDENTCWNIFDYTSASEPLWNLLSDGEYIAARRAAILLTLRHPFRMLRVIVACHSRI